MAMRQAHLLSYYDRHGGTDGGGWAEADGARTSPTPQQQQAEEEAGSPLALRHEALSRLGVVPPRARPLGEAARARAPAAAAAAALAQSTLSNDSVVLSARADKGESARVGPSATREDDWDAAAGSIVDSSFLLGLIRIGIRGLAFGVLLGAFAGVIGVVAV